MKQFNYNLGETLRSSVGELKVDFGVSLLLVPNYHSKLGNNFSQIKEDFLYETVVSKINLQLKNYLE
jgi:hypothetical protein